MALRRIKMIINYPLGTTIFYFYFFINVMLIHVGLLDKWAVLLAWLDEKKERKRSKKLEKVAVVLSIYGGDLQQSPSTAWSV